MFSFFYNGKLPNNFEFDNYFAEIASDHIYQTRLAALQNYNLPRMEMSLGQVCLKYVGPKIWSIILCLKIWNLFPLFILKTI